MLRVLVSAYALVAFLGGALGTTEPRLPAVAEMLNASTQTLRRINKQVKSMKSRMADFGDQQQKELAELKDGYEQQLAEEESQNRELQDVNEHTTEDIWKLEKGNLRLRQQAKELQIDNQELRKVMATVQDKVSAAGEYVNSTLDATNDKGAASLRVLGRGSKARENADSTAEDTNVNVDKEIGAAADADASAADADADGLDKGVDAEKDAAVVDAGAAVVDADALDKGADADEDTAAADADKGEDVEKEAPPQEETDKDGEVGQSLIAIRFRHRALRGRRALRAKHAFDEGDGDKKEEEGDAEEEDAANGQASEDSEEQQDGEEDAEVLNATSPHSPSNHVSQSLVHSLSEELQQLDKQDADSRKQMSRLFKVELAKRKKAQAGILSKQMALNATRVSLTEVHESLEGAVNRLEDTQAQLKKRLHGLGLYLEKLAAFVSKPAPEAEQKIPSLSSDVEAFLQQEKRAGGRAQVPLAAH